MKAFERVTKNNEVIALIIRHSFSSKEGVEFFTPDEYSQQLAYMNRPKGHIIRSHFHNQVTREVKYTQEVLYIRSGKMKVNLFDSNLAFVTSKILQDGDVILLASGGHGFEMLEKTEFIEIKQGPYAGDSDKEAFDSKME